MKRIRPLDGPTPGLARYLAHAGANATWERFRRNQDRRHELYEALTDLQHGLCGYCEIDLREDDRQVEHVIARNQPQEGAARALDPANLILCCLGGTKETSDNRRFLPTTPASLSCGQAKDNSADPDFIDPRTLPALPSLTRVRYDGRIEADRDACEKTGFSVDAVNKTIEILGLNVGRLRLARRERWRALDDNWQEHLGDLEIIEAASRMELLPQPNGRLLEFFTTSRSYFSPLGENILAERPADWI